MSNKYTITIGADPEFFVCDPKTNLPVPSCRKFGGEKGAAMFLSPDGGYLEDGTAVEFNVTPSKTLLECRKKIENLILIFLNKHEGYAISKYSSAMFTSDLLKTLPEAMQIGCSPDLFAYGLRVAPSIAKFGAQRFAGGHVHLGIDPWPEGLDKQVCVKLMDALLVWPVADRFVDGHRYPFYGHCGLYRETSYGIEHRSPDNWWCNPTLFADATNAERGYILDVIKHFDWIVESIGQMLNADGHGARVNDDIKRRLKPYGMDQSLGSLQNIQKPGILRNLRTVNKDLYTAFDRDRRARSMNIKGSALLGE